MYRLKNFLAMKVSYSNGKKIGIINDIAINFNDKKVEGYSVTVGNMLQRKNKIIRIEDIIYYDKSMIVSKITDEKKFTFNKIKGMEVVDICGNIIGVTEDLLFDTKFNIRGIIICSGMLKKLVDGKRVLLINELIIGERDILYYGKDKFKFLSLRHSISGVECYE